MYNILCYVSGFVTSPAVARGAQFASRNSQDALRSVSSVAGRQMGGVLMAAPESTPEGSDTYTFVVVR